MAVGDVLIDDATLPVNGLPGFAASLPAEQRGCAPAPDSYTQLSGVAPAGHRSAAPSPQFKDGVLLCAFIVR